MIVKDTDSFQPQQFVLGNASRYNRFMSVVISVVIIILTSTLFSQKMSSYLSITKKSRCTKKDIPKHAFSKFKYLVRKLVCYYSHNALFIAFCGYTRLVQECRLSVGDKSPVLHRSKRVVGYSYHVCNGK